jgi:hypothetical protein
MPVLIFFMEFLLWFTDLADAAADVTAVSGFYARPDAYVLLHQ